MFSALLRRMQISNDRVAAKDRVQGLGLRAYTYLSSGGGQPPLLVPLQSGADVPLVGGERFPQSGRVRNGHVGRPQPVRRRRVRCLAHERDPAPDPLLQGLPVEDGVDEGRRGGLQDVNRVLGSGFRV